TRRPVSALTPCRRTRSTTHQWIPWHATNQSHIFRDVVVVPSLVPPRRSFTSITTWRCHCLTKFIYTWTITTQISSLIIQSPSTAFQQVTITHSAVRKDDVLIDIAYAGICHSDIHNARDEWSPGIYPMVPGHEIAGVVAEVGSQVTKFKV